MVVLLERGSGDGDRVGTGQTGMLERSVDFASTSSIFCWNLHVEFFAGTEVFLL